MIVLSAKDPILLWYDLMTSWVSGQEAFIEEAYKAKYLSYANVLTTQWNFIEVERKLPNLLKMLGSEAATIEYTPQELKWVEGTTESSVVDLTTTLHWVTKATGKRVVYVSSSQLELVVGLPSLLWKLQMIFKAQGLLPLTPIVFCPTSGYFSRVKMPLLMPILGKRAFFDYELLELLNRDISRLDSVILKDDYRHKAHQEVWKHVVEVMARTDRAS